MFHHISPNVTLTKRGHIHDLRYVTQSCYCVTVKNKIVNHIVIVKVVLVNVSIYFITIFNFVLLKSRKARLLIKEAPYVFDFP